eukprot:m.23979 g.23979  ORF g.23979 m.23979 type:complete len:66 (-) comp4121_c0_seq1:984-1181(-)
MDSTVGYVGVHVDLTAQPCIPTPTLAPLSRALSHPLTGQNMVHTFAGGTGYTSGHKRACRCQGPR